MAEDATPRDDLQPPPPSQHEMGFVPRELVVVTVGRLTAKLYPVLEPSWPVHERAHAFQINKAALENLPVEIGILLDVFGAQLNSSTTVEGKIQDWKEHFDSMWHDFSRLSIQTFHSASGAVINDTTTAADPCILLPVIDGDPANCRSEGVRFVRVQCTLDFRPLVTIDPPGNTILRVSYYLELPQSTVAMQDDGGNPYNLTTFHGAADIRTIPIEEVRAHILDPRPVPCGERREKTVCSNIST